MKNFLGVHKLQTGRPIHIKFSGIEENHTLVSDIQKVRKNQIQDGGGCHLEIMQIAITRANMD